MGPLSQSHMLFQPIITRHEHSFTVYCKCYFCFCRIDSLRQNYNAITITTSSYVGKTVSCACIAKFTQSIVLRELQCIYPGRSCPSQITSNGDIYHQHKKQCTLYAVGQREEFLLTNPNHAFTKGICHNHNHKGQIRDGLLSNKPASLKMILNIP